MLLGKLDICMQKAETRSMCFTLYKNQLKARPWWLKPIILVTQEAEIRRIMV
jgi:hypothetical protein